MAIYHFSTNVHSRGKGHSAVAAAAYRSGEKLYDERIGAKYNWVAYRKSHGAVLASDIFLPKGVDHKYSNREYLWNGAESAEKTKAGAYKKTAAIAREMEGSLPHEMTDSEREDLARKGSEFFVNRYGTAVDMNIHAPHPDSNDKNYHVHFLMPTRKLEKRGFTQKTELELDGKSKKKLGLETGQNQIKAMRKDWADLVNRELERGGYSDRVDHRSFKDQGIEKVPTKHMGASATAMKRRGQETQKGNRNIEIEKLNDLLKLEAAFNKIGLEIKHEQDRINERLKAKAIEARKMQSTKAQTQKKTEVWDRDKANQEWKDSIADAGIEAEKLRLQKEKTKGKSNAGSGGFMPKAPPNPAKQDHSYAEYLDKRRAYQGKKDQERDQLENKLEKAYTLEQTRGNLKEATQRAKDSNSLWGRSTGKHKQALEDMEDYKKTLANINQRQSEARGALEKKLEAERPITEQTPKQDAPPKLTPERQHKSIEEMIKTAEAKAGTRVEIKPEFEKTGANDNLDDMIKRAEQKAREEAQKRENAPDRGKDRGGYER
jgi:hypothetical protein